MESDKSDELSNSELESRVDELEQTVRKMLPNRRGVLKGLGAAAVGGAAVGGATGGASGQSAAGQVGTDSERVDVFANELNGADVSTTTSGQVPTSQGDGTLAMEGGGGALSTLTPLEAVTDPEAPGGNSLAIGVAQNDSTTTSAGGDNSIAIGNGTVAEGFGNGAVSIGTGSIADGNDVVSVGINASATANEAMSIGYDTSTTDFAALAIGSGASSSGVSALSLGPISSADGESAVAIGQKASAVNDFEGVLGTTDTGDGTYDWTVPGDFTVNGSKNFEIDDPARPDTHDLRHGVYEGDVAGGLIYRRGVSITAADDTGTETVQMPDWFGPLATNVDVVVQAQGHFGDAYAERDEPGGETITVTANASGEYAVIIFATRDDANVASPADHEVTKPKGERWSGEPRAYYRDAPDVDPDTYGVERIEQFFDHGTDCDPEPCETAFERWRVTLDDGERADVEVSLDTDVSRVVEQARAEVEK